jgi:hypothetical protein
MDEDKGQKKGNASGCNRQQKNPAVGCSSRHRFIAPMAHSHHPSGGGVPNLAANQTVSPR